jgi:ribosomal protein S18 acetylase RimI-like enzyme
MAPYGHVDRALQDRSQGNQMDVSSVPASNYPLSDLVQFLNEGFEDYIIPIQFTTVTFLSMLRKDGTDLTASRVLLQGQRPCGIALIARRGWTSRLAAMGIAKPARGQGTGSWFMEELIKDAHQRGDREIVLEVIEQNEPAVRLYRKHGFQTVRRLIGLVCKSPSDGEGGDLHEMDLRELARLVSLHGLPDLPWQLSGESLARLTPPARAYRQGQAVVAISNPDVERVVIWSLLVEPGGREKGAGPQLLKSLMAHHPGKIWHVPAILPEELGTVFTRAGFEREDLSQWQMRLSL